MNGRELKLALQDILAAGKAIQDMIDGAGGLPDVEALDDISSSLRTADQRILKLMDAIIYHNEVREVENIEHPERCPGCSCEPGDGFTADCHHPYGCGFFKAIRSDGGRQ